MLKKEQRRKNHNNPNSSRLPIPAPAPATHATHRRHITTESAVTPTKLDDNKNNNKSRLFSTTCSRMAQEAKNYNKRPIIQNKNLSSFYLSPQQKMNLKNKRTIPVPSKKPTTTPATPVVTPTLRKSPLTLLKQDLEKLRQKKLDDEALIQKQSKEIARLKKQLTRQVKTEAEKELEFQLQEKSRLNEKLASVTAQAKSLSIDVVDLLEVKNSTSTQTTYQDEIDKLQSQLEIQDDAFKKKLAEHASLANALDRSIQQTQETTDKLKSDHATKIAQLKAIHSIQLNKLQVEHEQDMIKSRREANRSKHTSISSVHGLEEVLEQALLEFEQEQHNHIPVLIQQQDSNERSLQGKVRLTMKNQQWYANKYMPIDAKSWPAPQPLSNLNRVQQPTR
ncbi:hypothetical protein INT47_009948 [Mucor saturninus]|uniref:Uncharacterized protein n=1 Tax=Mucor saturninus TaxID=64648 RepID=A0A8H7V2Y3_9FUNG|nr:hypothetical protein INT47_009948 [Mucor saturninus]